MDPGNARVLSAESSRFFGEGISLVLSRWTALQMAVENQWGGVDSRQKSADLASAIFSWFTQSRDVLYIDDLENMLDETMEDVFCSQIEDGSIEEVAEQLMVMHEDCLKGNFQSIENLRNSVPRINAVSQSIRVSNGDDGDESSSDEDTSLDMVVDEPVMPMERAENRPNRNQLTDEDGWSVVTHRRNRGGT